MSAGNVTSALALRARLLFAFVVAFVALHFFAPHDAWCVNYFRTPARILLLGALGCTYVPFTSFHEPSRRLSEWLDTRPRRVRLALYAALSSLSLVPFYWLSDRRRYGDGPGLISSITQGYQYDPHAPLGIYLQSALYRFTRRTFGLTAAESWGWTSAVSGTLFLFALLVFSEAELFCRARFGRCLFICLVLSQASTQLFFFEVEDYAISTFFVLLYIATAYTSLDRRSVPFAAGLSLGFALTFSMSTAFLLPSFAWLTLERVRAARKASSTTGPVTTGLVAVASIASPLLLVFGFLALVEKVDVIALYRHSHLANYRVYMRLYGAPRSTLSLQHMTDVLQLNVLVAPFSVLLSAMFLRAAARYGALSDAFFRFCAALTLCAWVFLIFWIPGFPMQIDWDLFSMFALPTTTFAFLTVLYSRCLADPRTRRSFFQLLSVAAVHTAVWIWTGHFT